MAVSMGVTGLESDVWLAADGVPVLVHDRVIHRDQRRIDVTRATSRELAAHGVPSLSDLYRVVGASVALSLDLEHEAVVGPTLATADAHGALSALWACSPDVELLASLRRAGDVNLVCSTRPRRVAGGVRALLSNLAAHGIDVLNMHSRDWTRELVDAAHDMGVGAFGWDAQDEATISRLVDLGADAIYSDYPDRLVRVIGQCR